MKSGAGAFLGKVLSDVLCCCPWKVNCSTPEMRADDEIASFMGRPKSTSLLFQSARQIPFELFREVAVQLGVRVRMQNKGAGSFSCASECCIPRPFFAFFI